jgi:hypothetical protein
VVCAGLALALPLSSEGGVDYTSNGGEYAIGGARPTDQVYPRVAISSSGGYLVWQDTATDGEGLGVSALQLDTGLSGSLSAFRVNQVGADDQERPVVTVLKDGGAVFVWQGGKLGFQHIFARVLAADGTWATDEIRISTPEKDFQIYPAAATLANGNVVIVWASFNQVSGTSMQDVYGQILSPSGAKVGGEFLINQFTGFNQRSPAVAALANGGFVATWVSEQQRKVLEDPNSEFVYQSGTGPSVDIYARLYNGNGSPSGSEFLVNQAFRVCANPAVAPGAQGGFRIAWAEKDTQVIDNSWDIYSRSYDANGSAVGTAARVNTQAYGEQFYPQLTALDSGYMVVWNSLGQDGSREGVYGQFLNLDGSPSGAEFRVNTTTVSRQIHPSAASDESGRALVVWTSFVGGVRSFDVFAQRYGNVAQPLVRMDAPFVHVPFVLNGNVYEPRIEVSWPVQSGLPVTAYEVYVNGATTPIASLPGNAWTMTAADGLKPATTVSFSVTYVNAEGQRAPLSPSSAATTWSGNNARGLPYEWLTENFGNDPYNWPLPTKELEAGGPTVFQVFLSGGDPNDQSTWLRTTLEATSNGNLLSWNSKPGLLYQVQTSSDLQTWTNIGAPRFAAGTVDSLNVGTGQAGYYRIVLLR